MFSRIIILTTPHHILDFRVLCNQNYSPSVPEKLSIRLFQATKDAMQISSTGDLNPFSMT